MSKIVNESAYKSLQGPVAKKVKIVLEVALDPVFGWGDNAEDHIALIFKNNPYVLTAEVKE